MRFEGRRYQVTRGSLDFTNPNADSAVLRHRGRDARARARADLPRHAAHGGHDRSAAAGRSTSDPPLAPIDILTLLFSDTAPTGDIELASLRQPNQREQDLLQARATRALTGALSDEVGRVVEQTFGVDTFQITPLLIDPYQQSSRLNVNPAARVTIGKRISDRVYLTYARSLSSSSATRSSCSNTIRTIASAGSCRRTKTAPTRSKSERHSSDAGSMRTAARGRDCCALCARRCSPSG